MKCSKCGFEAVVDKASLDLLNDKDSRVTSIQCPKCLTVLIGKLDA